MSSGSITLKSLGILCLLGVLAPLLGATELVDPNVTTIIEEYEQKANDAPKNPKAQGELGIVYELHGFLQDAIEQYQLAAELDVQEPRWFYYEALLHASHYDRKQALDTLVKAMNIDPTYGPGWLYRGTWFLQLNEPAHARAAFEKAKELGSVLPAEVGIAQANLALRDSDAVIEQLGQLDVDRLHPMLINLLGKAYLQKGDRPRGRGLLQRVKSIPSITWQDPWINETGKFKGDTLARRLDYSELLMGMNRKEDALKVLEDLERLYPQNRRVLFNLSAVYQVNGDLNAAVQTLQQGLRAYPDYYPYHVGIANLYKIQRDVNKAIDHLDIAIQLDPKASQAYEQKGQIMIERRDWEAARLNFAIAKRLEPTNPNTLVYLGMALGMLDEWQQASGLFHEAILIDEGFIPAYVNLSRAFAILGQYDDARGIVNDLKTMGAPDSNVQALLGQIKNIEEMRK